MKTLAMLILLPALTFAQQATYNPATKTISVNVSNDTSTQMCGCVGNNYNSEGQCEGGIECVYHTGTVSVSLTNTRTKLNSAQSQTITGGLASATASIGVQPGDIISYSETNEVYCPIANVNNGYTGTSGFLELASTRVQEQSLAASSGSNSTWNVREFCSNTSTPDYAPGQITDSTSPSPSGWDLDAICFSTNSKQPWSCYQALKTKLTGAITEVACTVNQ